MKGAGSAGYTWRKLASAKWEDAWNERLAGVRDRLAVTLAAGGRMMRLEVYGLRRQEAQRLQQAFGGQSRRERQSTRIVQPPARAPIRIRSKLLIVSTPGAEAGEVSARSSRARLIHIPAGMAFGTGDHATTAFCLRLLADVSDELEDGAWHMLDLGTGSGILAIAARAFGARSASGWDFDRDAVRVARENIRRNRIDRVTALRRDVRAWYPNRTWQVVVANLYSELLMEIAPTIAGAVATDGYFIFSGILRQQESEVVPVLRRAGFRVVKIVRSAKWVAGLARRTGQRTRRVHRSAGGATALASVGVRRQRRG